MKDGLRFLTGEPGLKIGRALVVSDLHIGIEHRYREKGISLPSQSESLASKLELMIRQARAKRLVVLGDIKHRVPGTSFQEEREIPGFFRNLLEKVDSVEVTPGNHDDGIDRLLPEEVKLYPGTGFRLGNAWLCHGHAWPPEEFLDCREVVIGHNHAGIEFRDGLGYRWVEKVWMRTKLDRKRLSERYKILKAMDRKAIDKGLPGREEGKGLPGRDEGKGLPGREEGAIPEMVLIPPINDFTGLVPSNREGRLERHFRESPSPLFRAAVRNTSRVYLLDGTYLGELGGIMDSQTGSG